MNLCFAVIAMTLTLSGCTKSVRLPEMGPPITPIGIPEDIDDAIASLPDLLSLPIAPNDATVAPVFQPERLMVWHVQGYTKNNSVFIGPHTVVLKVEPGRFVRELDSTAKIPVAAKFIEVAPDRTAVRDKADTIQQNLKLPNLQDLPETVKAQVEAIQNKAPGE